ncbi:hypothetical protein H7K45_27700 [Mycobacterium yunnanensis]|uniref:Tail assembly chaperone n=1 Tax=Mycobacterium yunnanensis TaxID=368477 RepID=A0A9X2ZBC7_9MYCO|nr:hypothetical protein [Mycobacterium yunnanensis]MCV7424337.1 hypothetical protein [Mycobacterium yunnanensis]
MTVYASEGSTSSTAPVPDVPTDEPTIDTVTVEEEPAAAEPADPEPAAPSDAEDTIDAEVVTAVDTIPDDDKWTHETDWAYDELDYKGDLLAFRVPASNALTALYQAQGTCSDEFVMKLTNKFVQNHLSQKSIERVLERMSDPDDTEFADSGVWNDLLSRIAEIGGDRALKDAEALAAVTSGKGK